MSRAQDLFERLVQHGVPALEAMLRDFEPESLFLDFKRAATARRSRGLDRNDEDNLAKAISGFANAEGGVLVFGVRYQRDSDTQREAAIMMPLEDPTGFQTLVEEALSRLTIPPVRGLRTWCGVESAGTGYVALLVPASLGGPVRSVRSNHYHLRVGSSFGIVPHAVLAGMFGQSPQPIITPQFFDYPVRMDEWGKAVNFAFGLAGANTGGVLASKLYLSGWFRRPPPAGFHVSESDKSRFALSRGRLPGFSVVAHDGIDVPPGAVEDVCSVNLSVPVGYGDSITLDLILGARGAAPTSFTLQVDGSILANRGAGQLGGHTIGRASDFFTVEGIALERAG